MSSRIQQGILYELISKHYGLDTTPNKALTGIEIGTLNGKTGCYLLDNIPGLTLYTVDPSPDKYTMLKDWDKSAGTINRYKFIETTSDNAYKLFRKIEIDFVWVDGDHSYKQCKKDIKNYLPLIKNDGFIGGHDYGSASFEGVKRAVDEAFPKVITDTDFTWWVYL